MDVEVINPFVIATRDVFDKMLGCPIERGALELVQDHQPEYHISGVITLTGRASGLVVATFHRDVAIGVTESLSGLRPDGIDENVRDAVGEMANMIVGAAKGRLEKLKMSISLPSVITGRNHIIAFPKQAPPVSIPYLTRWGPFAIQVGMGEESLSA